VIGLRSGGQVGGGMRSILRSALPCVVLRDGLHQRPRSGACVSCSSTEDRLLRLGPHRRAVFARPRRGQWPVSPDGSVARTGIKGPVQGGYVISECVIGWRSRRACCTAVPWQLGGISVGSVRCGRTAPVMGNLAACAVDLAGSCRCCTYSAHSYHVGAAGLVARLACGPGAGLAPARGGSRRGRLFRVLGCDRSGLSWPRVRRWPTSTCTAVHARRLAAAPVRDLIYTCRPNHPASEDRCLSAAACSPRC